VKLKKQGPQLVGLCPFHNEKSPSFTVSIPKQMYKCFGCGESGDGIQFVMKNQKKTFAEAIEWVASFYNIAIELEQETAEDKAKRQETKDVKKAMLSALKQANDLYHKHLMDLPDESDVWKYLLGRDITREIATFWQIGFAPMERKFVTSPLISAHLYQGASDCGLSYTGKDGMPVDFFCNRIIFPIQDMNGHIISMGGRIVPTGDKKVDKKYPKWKNLPESLIYKKSLVLYGLYQALTAKAFNETKYGIPPAYVVEGYTDVIFMHEAGVFSGLGSCGTSITVDQLKLIKRYTSTIALYQDGTTTELKNGEIHENDSGQKAMMKAIDKCLAEGLRALVIDTPGKDPDEYAREYMKSTAKKSQPKPVAEAQPIE
jgi:DNA primase